MAKQSSLKIHLKEINIAMYKELATTTLFITVYYGKSLKCQKIGHLEKLDIHMAKCQGAIKISNCIADTEMYSQYILNF